jgi:hypothetical protein
VEQVFNLLLLKSATFKIAPFFRRAQKEQVANLLHDKNPKEALTPQLMVW